MKKFTLLVTLLFISIGIFAIPAQRNTKKVKQSDGTELVVRLVGDESFHYYSTLDGVPLVCDANGDFHYARLTAEGRLVTTNTLAHSANIRSANETALVALIAEDNSDSNIAKVAARRAERFNAPRRKASQTIAPIGEINVPVLLVEFADQKFTFTKDYASQTFNGTEFKGPENPFISETEGSLRDYFIAQSDGQFRPNFIVTDIITLSKNMSYYGGNDTDGNDKNPQQMIIDACRAADSNFDFSIFDNDGDGTIEFLYCLYAGYAEAAGAPAETIWPHQWYLSSYAGKIKLDGVYVDNYACSSELSLNADYAENYGVNFTGIGSCCHEFSHSLGLPDFYDTSSNNPPNFGMDYWDLMDYGCYNVNGYVPVGYSAYERDFMGWRKLEILTDKGDYSMSALTAGGKGYKVVNENNPNEYYILENRQNESWDKYIFNSGMLITHVDYLESAWFYNTVNNEKTHQRFTIIPADNELLTYYTASSYDDYVNSLSGDTWPGSTNNTELTDYTTPAATVYTGDYMGKPITNIKNESGIVSFSFMKGLLTVPQIEEATNITANSFVANWEALEAATGYTVSLELIDMSNSGATETLLSEDFIKLSSNNLLLSSLDTYLSTSGWTGSRVYTATGAMRIGTAATAGTLKTPALTANGKVTVNFRLKLYNTNDSGSVLTLNMVDKNGTKTKIADYTATSSYVSHSVVIDAPDSEFYVEFTTENSASSSRRVTIDDINVTVETSYSVTLVETVETSTNNHKFENLESGAKYRYSVTATDGIKITDSSEFAYVTLLATGIDSVLSDEDINGVYYDLTGRMVENPSNGIYLIKKGNKVQKVFIK